MQRLNLWLLAVLLGATGPLAQAHAHLLSIVPSNDQVLQVSPPEIVLTFSEKVHFDYVHVHRDSFPITVSVPSNTSDKLIIRVGVRGNYPAGKFTIEYRALDEEGHGIVGKHSFMVLKDHP